MANMFDDEEGAAPAAPTNMFDDEGESTPRASARTPEAPKKSYDETDDYAGRHLRAGIAQALKAAGHAGTVGAGGLVSGVGSLFGKPELGDPIFDLVKPTEKHWDDVIKKEIGDVDSGVGGKVLQGIGQAPAWLSLPTAATQIAGLGMEQGTSVIDEGGSLKTALAAAGVSTATNAALFALPPSIRAPLVARIMAGGALGAFETYLEPALVNEIRKAAELKEREMPGWKDYVAGVAMTGTVAGVAGKGKPKTDKTPEPTPADKARDLLISGKKAEEDLKRTSDILMEEMATRAAEEQVAGQRAAEIPPDFEQERPLPTVEGTEQLPPMIPEIQRPEQGPELGQLNPELPGTPRPVVPEAPLPEVLRQEVPPTDGVAGPAAMPPRPLPEVPGLLPPEVPRMPEAPPAQPPLPQPNLMMPEAPPARPVQDGMPPRPQEMPPSLPVSPEAPRGLPAIDTPPEAPRAPERPLPMIDETMIDPLSPAKDPATAPAKAADPEQLGLKLTGGRNAKGKGKTSALLGDTEGKRMWFVEAEGPKGVIDLRSALNKILQAPAGFLSAGYKELSAKVLRHLEGTGITVRMVDELPNGATGLYSHNPHTIFLKRGPGNNSQVLMHELIHAVTGRWMEANPNHPLVKRIAAMRDQLIDTVGRDHYAIRGDLDDPSNPLNTPHEFVAEVRSNPALQKVLSQSKVGRGILERIKETVRNILKGQLKLAPKEISALDHLSKLIDDVMEKQSDLGLKPNQLPDMAVAKTNAAEDVLGGKEPRKELPKSDNGAINADLVTGGLTTARDRVSTTLRKPSNSESPLSLPERQHEAASKIPGMDLKDWVSPDVDPAQVIEMSRQEGKDVPLAYTDELLSGSEQRASIKNSPALYAAESYFKNAHSRHNLFDRMFLQPLRQQVSKMMSKKWEDAEQVMQVLQTEAKAKTRLSPEQLELVGFTPEQRSIYEGYRKTFDSQLEMINAKRKEQGQEPISAEDAYVSAARRGNWFVDVYGKDGKLKWHIQETSRGRARTALDHILKNEPDIDGSKSKIEMKQTADNYSGFAGVSKLDALMQILGKDDPLVNRIKELMNAKTVEEGSHAYGYDKHFIEKTGVKGEMGAQPWKSRKHNVEEFFRAQNAVLTEGSLWGQQQTAVSSLKDVMNDPFMKSDRPNTVKLLREKMHDEMGYGALTAVRQVENWLSKHFGNLAYGLGKAFPPLKRLPTDMSSINTALGVGKALFYMRRLGLGNVKFAGISILQMAYQVPHHMQLSAEGYSHNPLKTMNDSIWMSSAALMSHYAPRRTDYFNKIKHHLDDLTINAIKYMDANGVSALNQSSEAGSHIFKSPGGQKFERYANSTISDPERIARTEVFMSFVTHLNQSGRFKGANDMALFAKADELTNRTMGNYHKSERARVFNRLGTLGSAMNPLQTFRLTQLAQEVAMTKFALRNKTNPRAYGPLAAQSMILVSMAGMMGVVGIDTADALIDKYKEWYANGGGTDASILDFSLKQMLANNLDQLWNFGFFSQLAGRDVSSSSSAGQIIEPTFDGLLPVVSDIGREVMKWGEFSKNRDQQSFDRAVHHSLPTSVQNAAEMRLPTMTNPDAPELIYPHSDPLTPLDYERTPEDIRIKSQPFTGGTTVRESANKQAEYRVLRNEQMREKSQKANTEKVIRNLTQGRDTEMLDALDKYLELDGDINSLVSQMTNSQKDRFLSTQKRLQMRASTPKALNRMMRFEDAMKNVRSYK